MPVGALIVHSLVMIVFCLSAFRLRPRAPEAQSGRRAGGAGLDLKGRARFGSVLPVLPSPRGVHPHVPSAAM
jgi:hypothetical protein